MKSANSGDLIDCPRCHRPGVLFIEAAPTIDRWHVAQVMHGKIYSSNGGTPIRSVCLLRQQDVDSIESEKR